MAMRALAAAGVVLMACSKSPAPAPSRTASDAPPPPTRDSSVTMPPTDPASSDAVPVPPHLAHFPGLSVRQGDRIVPAPEADAAVARGYPTAATKGGWADGRRITILTARAAVTLGEPVRVVHVVESVRAGDELYVMGPKAVLGEHVDGVLRTAAAPAQADPLEPPGLYDGAVLPAPAADYNYDVTEYTFDRPGAHTIEWKLGPLQSNTLTIDVTP
jgi:hypothetical protein